MIFCVYTETWEDDQDEIRAHLMTAALREAAALRGPGEIEPVIPLDELRAFYARFLYAAPEALDTMTVWAALTHVYEVFTANPRVAFMGDKGAGKSTALGLLKLFVARPVKTGNASDAAVFSIIAERKPTLLFDETDTIFGPLGNTRKGENLRGLLDDGYTEGDADDGVLRMSGRQATIMQVYCPVAFGGIGNLPKTLDDRSVTVRMVKPFPVQAEQLEEWDPDLYGEEAHQIREALVPFIMERAAEMERTPPRIPKGVVLRAKQIWKPLIAVGDACSPEWGARMRDACRFFVLGVSGTPVMAPGEELCRCVAEYASAKPEIITTGELIDLLVLARKSDGRLGWATWLDNPVTAAKSLSSLLRPYGIKSVQFTRNKHNRRGYRVADFRLWAEVGS